MPRSGAWLTIELTAHTAAGRGAAQCQRQFPIPSVEWTTSATIADRLARGEVDGLDWHQHAVPDCTLSIRDASALLDAMVRHHVDPLRA